MVGLLRFLSSPHSGYSGHWGGSWKSQVSLVAESQPMDPSLPLPCQGVFDPAKSRHGERMRSPVTRIAQLSGRSPI